MKIAIIYNRDSQAVINLFGVPNREKYGLQTIQMIQEALKSGGHQVKTFEGDKNIIHQLEEFMPSVISRERPGLVFNLSYGIQGRARYTHIPGILEMLGIPYVGSGPQTHAIALDKVTTKMVLIQKGLPTPRFAVLESPEFHLSEALQFPLIVKPKDEAASLGLRIVRSEEELLVGTRAIFEQFGTQVLVEEYIDGREINVGLLGNDPVQALPPVELIFHEGEKVFTYEDKLCTSNRFIEKVCPAPLSPADTEKVQALAAAAFKALDCFDSARVDFRLDAQGNPYILEINSMASLGPDSSFVVAAETAGLDYTALANRLIEIASRRYFGPTLPGKLLTDKDSRQEGAFDFLTQNRDGMEEKLKFWTNQPGWTDDAVALGAALKRFGQEMEQLGLKEICNLTNQRSAWTWQTTAGFKDGTLLVVPFDVPRERGGFPIPFRRDPEWLCGEGIASSRAGIVCLLQSLASLHAQGLLPKTRTGVFLYSDEGQGMRYSSPVLRQAAERAARVLVLQPGLQGGKVINQRRGSRKYNILVEGDPLRIGVRGEHTVVLTWFLEKAGALDELSRPERKLAVALQELHSERFSKLLPHRIRATVCTTFLDAESADLAEEQIKEIFSSDKDDVRAYVEKLEARPPLLHRDYTHPLIRRMKQICEAWKLPFDVDSGLLPSAAGVIPEGIPVLCGCGPAGRGLYTPYECVHRGELLQRTLLLALFLLEDQISL